MKRITFEKLPKITDFEVDARQVHSGGSKITLLHLKRGETAKLPSWDFQTHVTVLDGEIRLKVEDVEEEFKRGCVASVLPDQEIEISAIEESRIMLIRDDPVWVLKERRSIRAFSSEPVPEETIKKIISLSVLSPSAGNLQPWRIYITKDEKLKRELANASWGQDHVYQAPWVIVVCAVPEESASKYEERGRNLYSIQDTASLTLYIMLAAKAYGLDTCWVGAFDEDRVWKLLGSPEGERPVAIIPMGYGAEKPEPPYRKSLDRILKTI